MTDRTDYDVVVIGSGDSVAALRLTGKGYRVAVPDFAPTALRLPIRPVEKARPVAVEA